MISCINTENSIEGGS
uniref:Uncharacterized protein n=1 Tax=Arundo donax TaxID=35708 RepID=A0A0A8ZKH2_ARUDO